MDIYLASSKETIKWNGEIIILKCKYRYYDNYNTANRPRTFIRSTFSLFNIILSFPWKCHTFANNRRVRNSPWKFKRENCLTYFIATVHICILHLYNECHCFAFACQFYCQIIIKIHYQFKSKLLTFIRSKSVKNESHRARQAINDRYEYVVVQFFFAWATSNHIHFACTHRCLETAKEKKNIADFYRNFTRFIIIFLITSARHAKLYSKWLVIAPVRFECITMKFAL